MMTLMTDFDSRFAACTKRSAIFVVITMLAVIALGVIFHPSTTAVITTTTIGVNTDRNPDLTLYSTIIKNLQMGQNYYPAMAKLLREGGYPLRPFVAFRLPTLAVVSATLGMPVMYGLLWITMLATLYVWWKRLNNTFHLPARRITGVGLVVVGLAVSGRPNLIVFHEVWAGLFIMLALGLYTPIRWLPSVLLGLCAGLIRETAIPFVFLMAAHAGWERRGKEFMGWMLCILLFCVALIFQRTHVIAVTTAADIASPGWVRFGGWSFFVNVMSQTTFLRAFPEWVSAILVPFALLGWASWRSLTGLLGFFLLSGFALMLMMFGRPDNFYWGLIVAPLLPLGLAFVPLAVRDLHAAIMSK